MSPHPTPIAHCPPTLRSPPIEILTAAPPSPFSLPSAAPRSPPILSRRACSSLLLTMALILSSVEFGGGRCRCPSSPDYSSLAAAPSPRAASPEYTPVSRLYWRPPRMPEHEPSTTLRLGRPPVLLPLRRAASPDYSPPRSPTSPSRPALASPEYTPAVNRSSWRVGSPDYAPSTPTTTTRAASPDYSPSSSPSRPAPESPEYTPVNLFGWRAGSPDYAPSATPTCRVASPEYTPVSRLWTAAGSPDCAPVSPPRGAASPDYTPRTPPARAPPSPDYSPRTPPPSPLVSDVESGTSSSVRRYRRRHHPYQRSISRTFTWSASGINHGHQSHLVY